MPGASAIVRTEDALTKPLTGLPPRTQAAWEARPFRATDPCGTLLAKRHGTESRARARAAGRGAGSAGRAGRAAARPADRSRPSRRRVTQDEERSNHVSRRAASCCHPRVRCTGHHGMRHARTGQGGGRLTPRHRERVRDVLCCGAAVAGTSRGGRGCPAPLRPGATAARAACR